MTYASDLLNQLHGFYSFPGFDDPEFLEELEFVADDFLKKGSLEGAMAAILVYQQLTEEMLKVLILDSQFFIQLSIFPSEIEFQQHKKQMFGQLISSLEESASFPEKDALIQSANAINEHRIEIVHKLTRQTQLSDIFLKANEVNAFFCSISRNFQIAHSHFREKFREFRKIIKSPQ